MVHSNGWFCCQLGRGLVLEGIHHLFNTQIHVTGILEYTQIQGIGNMLSGIEDCGDTVVQHT